MGMVEERVAFLSPIQGKERKWLLFLHSHVVVKGVIFLRLGRRVGWPRVEPRNRR